MIENNWKKYLLPMANGISINLPIHEMNVYSVKWNHRCINYSSGPHLQNSNLCNCEPHANFYPVKIWLLNVIIKRKMKRGSHRVLRETLQIANVSHWICVKFLWYRPFYEKIIVYRCKALRKWTLRSDYEWWISLNAKCLKSTLAQHPRHTILFNLRNIIHLFEIL